MKEYYNLPVQFSEEERKAYAAYGIKKEKTLGPFAVIMLGIVVVVTVLTALYLLGLLKSGDSVYVRLVAGSQMLACAYEFGVLLLSFLIIKPLDMLFDKIYHKPEPSRMLRLEPREVGVTYELSQGKKVLVSGILLWDEWEQVVDAERNRIWIPDQWLTIGANTVESIYPKDKQHKWMDRPEEKIVGTIRLGEIQRKLDGYLASLEERKREEEWMRQHGSV